MGIKRWIQNDFDIAKRDKLQVETGISQLVCTILMSRNIATKEQADEFFLGDIVYESPFVIKDMDKAVARVQRAIDNDESIAVYGDYDCDGITSTAVLISYLQSVGGRAFYYIPDRESEGYGLNNSAIDTLNGMNVDLILTVDNGISAHSEIDYANSLGIDVVVTDHHTPRETLPNAYAVVNPHRQDCPSSFKDYAGVGVAFKLVCALEDADAIEILDLYSDLVCIGTIADVVSLKGENRDIVRHGLDHLAQSTHPGIHALLEQAGTDLSVPLTSENVAYGISPRLNAAGRMGKIDDAVELLITDDEGYAKELAESLQEMNLQRRSIEEDILNEVYSYLAQNPQVINRRIIIVKGEGWHQGVMGIVASRLLTQYGKPCIVFSQFGDEVRGSGRSIEGFDLIAAISACNKPLIHYGGHVMAAGVTLLESDLSDFDESLQKFASENYISMPVPSIHISAELTDKDLSIENIEDISKLGPFGSDNETPLFIIKNSIIKGIFPTKDRRHMRLKLGVNSGEFVAIYFGVGEEKFPYKVEDKVDLVAAVSVGVWNDSPQLSIKIEDLRRVDLPQEEIIRSEQCYEKHLRNEYTEICSKESLVPNREQFALVYRFIRQENGYFYGKAALYENFIDSEITYAQMCIVIDTFVELGLLILDEQGIKVDNSGLKVELEKSSILKSLQK